VAHSTRIAGLPVRRPTVYHGRTRRRATQGPHWNLRILAHLAASGNRVTFGAFGDGLFYSYRVYSHDLVAEWTDRLLALPCGPSDSRSWFHPLLTPEGVILSAIPEPRENKNAT